MVKIYTAVVNEPAPGGSVPHALTGTTEAVLRTQIRLRINFLQREIKRKLPLALLTLSFHLCSVVVAAYQWPPALLPLTAFAIIYLRFVPLSCNPVADIYYNWRYIMMWGVESERRSAADAMIGLRH